MWRWRAAGACLCHHRLRAQGSCHLMRRATCASKHDSQGPPTPGPMAAVAMLHLSSCQITSSHLDGPSNPAFIGLASRGCQGVLCMIAFAITLLLVQSSGIQILRRSMSIKQPLATTSILIASKRYCYEDVSDIAPRSSYSSKGRKGTSANAAINLTQRSQPLHISTGSKVAGGPRLLCCAVYRDSMLVRIGILVQMTSNVALPCLHLVKELC